MKKILLTIEYDGTNFSGWQRQPDCRTVQGQLEEVLSVLCKQEVVLQGTSRTDAGVHALGQRAAFVGDFGIPIDKIPIAANHLLSKNSLLVGDVRIIKAEEVDIEFHPRYDAVGKKYIYKMRNGTYPDIMARNYCYQIPKALDVAAMEKAADYLVGKQDFRCFMAAGGKMPESTVRTIYKSKFFSDGPQKSICSKNQNDKALNIRFEITGDGFLYNMVRIIVGTLVDIGLGKRRPDDMHEIILGKDRKNAGHTAPPNGLYLMEVYFEREEMLNENC